MITEDFLLSLAGCVNGLLHVGARERNVASAQGAQAAGGDAVPPEDSVARRRVEGEGRRRRPGMATI